MHLVIAVVLLSLGVYVLLRRASRAASHDPEVEAKLLHLCLGDRSQANRLIAAEFERDPSMGRAEAVRRAYLLLCRDKR